jgi:hypothetical protein
MIGMRGIGLILVTAGAGLVAAPAAARSAEGELSDQQVLEILTCEQPRDRAIRRALEWLRDQQEEDGSVQGKYKTAMTSLAITAHLAAGIAFDDPRHGPWLRKSIRYVLGQQQDSGYFGQKDSSAMYGHGITTLMLAEALGMLREGELEEDVRKALERAVAVTVNAARVKKSPQHAGGWRYTPTAQDSDLSLSGWQLMSLHASQQVGITVPEEVIRNAVAYARRNTGEDGRVGYQGVGDNEALRGLGMLCFAVGGQEKDKIVDRIGERIQSDPVEWKGNWLFYRSYYDAVGMSRARPELWASYSKVLEKVFIDNQKKDGSWPIPPGNNDGNHGGVYRTSLAVLVLTVDRHVLPAYQR